MFQHVIFPIIIIIIGFVLVTIVMKVNGFLVSKNALDQKGAITPKMIMSSIIKMSIVLLFVGVILTVMGLARF